MTSFNDREAAFEAKFAHDQELRFRLDARRDKLLGYWAAERLGLDAEETEAYVKQVILSDLEEAGANDVVRKLVGDLAEIGIDEAAIRAALAEQEAIARQQLMEQL
ncbi:aldolase [alpha proteobacterium AAP81b]|nr:aldolase [alpha proteobacterium AAP81b]